MLVEKEDYMEGGEEGEEKERKRIKKEEKKGVCRMRSRETRKREGTITVGGVVKEKEEEEPRCLTVRRLWVRIPDPAPFCAC